MKTIHSTKGKPGSTDRLLKAVNDLSNNVAKWMAAQDATLRASMQELIKLQLLQSEKLEAGFALVAEAIAKTNPPQPPRPNEGGILLARYRITEDEPAITFDLVGTGFKSGKGSDTGAADIDLSAESNSPGLTAELGPQVLSEDGKTVTAPVILTANSATVDMAVVTYKATNRDTGHVVAADSDEFIIGPGEATIGVLDSPVPLEAVVPE